MLILSIDEYGEWLVNWCIGVHWWKLVIIDALSVYWC